MLHNLFSRISDLVLFTCLQIEEAVEGFVFNIMILEAETARFSTFSLGCIALVVKRLSEMGTSEK